MKVTDVIGWVYESDRTAVKDAQNALDDFYLQDKIDDLNNTKEAENQILDDRIQNWQDYLDALDEKHNAYQAEVNEQLLFEQLNVTTQQELYATMYSDMTTYIANADAGAEEYIGIFTQFLEDYKACLEELAELNQMATTLYDFQNSNPQAGGAGTEIKDTTSYIDWGSDTNNYHQIALDAAASGDWDAVGEALNKRQNKVDATGNDRGTSNKDILNSIVDKYGSDVLGKIPEVKGYSSSSSSGSSSSSSNKGSNSSSSSSNKGGSTSPFTGGGTIGATIGSAIAGAAGAVVGGIIGSVVSGKKYSDGIENGAVTYTGLAMLHGTPTSPEYVLNSDQAYTLLHNLSTIKGTDYESVGSNEVNNFNFGDVNLPNVKDPSNFWSELMRATSNRFNVTKNK